MRNDSRKITTVTLLTFLVLQANAIAGIAIRRGNEVGFWTKYSVILAEIAKVEVISKDRASKGTHSLQVKPKATLSGNFDPGLCGGPRKLDSPIR